MGKTLYYKIVKKIREERSNNTEKSTAPSFEDWQQIFTEATLPNATEAALLSLKLEKN